MSKLNVCVWGLAAFVAGPAAGFWHPATIHWPAVPVVTSRGLSASPEPIEDLAFEWQAAEVAFCLGAQDTLISGPSIRKELNQWSNRVVRAIMTNPERVLEVRTELPTARAMIEAEDPDAGESMDVALAYFDCVGALLYGYESPQLAFLLLDSESTTETEKVEKGICYLRSYKRLRNLLRLNGVRFAQVDKNAPEDELRQSGTVPAPQDRDICLSMRDLMRMSPAGDAASSVDEDEDRIEPGREARFGRDGPAPATVTEELNRISNDVERTLLLGSTDDVARLQQDLKARRPELAERWGTRPAGEEGLAYFDALGRLVSEGVDVDYAQLKFSYRNAFDRLVGSLVKEIGVTPKASSRPDLELLNEFAVWERDVRKKSLTGLWNENPVELTGDWAIIESGDASLLSNPEIMSALRDSTDTKGAVQLTLSPQGTVTISSAQGGATGAQGVGWKLEPGPTHLDTCYITIKPGAGRQGDENLCFMGYIDRGQRVEARFSRRPVRMSGMVIASGSAAGGRSIGRFVMEKQV